MDHQLPTIEEVGDAAMFFLSDLSKGTSGSIHYVDHGVGIVG
ncbi:SDR family oxidoreductase [Amphritea sp.]